MSGIVTVFLFTMKKKQHLYEATFVEFQWHRTFSAANSPLWHAMPLVHPPPLAYSNTTFLYNPELNDTSDPGNIFPWKLPSLVRKSVQSKFSASHLRVAQLFTWKLEHSKVTMSEHVCHLSWPSAFKLAWWQVINCWTGLYSWIPKCHSPRAEPSL